MDSQFILHFQNHKDTICGYLGQLKDFMASDLDGLSYNLENGDKPKLEVAKTYRALLKGEGAVLSFTLL